MMSAVILPGLEVHFYLADTQQIIHLKGRHSAEQLCTEAAKKLGEFLRSALYCDTPLGQHGRSLIHFNHSVTNLIIRNYTMALEITLRC